MGEIATEPTTEFDGTYRSYESYKSHFFFFVRIAFLRTHYFVEAAGGDVSRT